MQPLRIFIGWDSTVPVAAEVCAYSLRRRSSIPLDIRFLVQEELRAEGLYDRPKDPLASTEFTYTRFLTPHLADHRGLAVFCDNDFLWQADIAEMLPSPDGKTALWCVQHDYRPTESVKMDGKVQTSYPRKNWSSLMVFDAGHNLNGVLTPDLVNRESGAFLHRFQWLPDDAIGALAPGWNWLEGSEPPDGGIMPKAIHYTRGGPWLPQWSNTAYADEWRAECAAMKAETLAHDVPESIS